MKLYCVKPVTRSLLTIALCSWVVVCGSPTAADSYKAVISSLPETISVSEVTQYTDMRFLDVRTHREWDAGHLKGALHVPVGDIGPESVAGFPKSQPLLVYCASGGRASRAVVLLRELGFSATAVRGGGFAELKEQFPATP